jgi:uncharacterized cupin superfamily protein
MTNHHTALAMLQGDLAESILRPPTAQPLDGDIVVRKAVFFTDDDHGITCGTWESEPGQSRWEFLERGEIIQVLAGRITVQRDGEQPVELVAGSTAIFPIGWTGIWTVHERLRKMFVIFAKRSPES